MPAKDNPRDEHTLSGVGHHREPSASHFPYPYRFPTDEGIDLLELWGIIWRGKWIVLAITAVFAVGAVIYALSLPNLYKSSTLLAPSDNAQNAGIARMAGQFSGLASLAGISLGAGGGADNVAVAIQLMQSRKFITDFVERHDILPELMAVESWDPITNTLTYSEDVYLESSGQWVRKVDPPREAKPSSWEAYEAFMERFTVTQDKENGFVTVEILHQSPHLAKEWVRLLVRDVNEEMRKQDISEAQKSVDYLQERLSQIALADMRTIFYQLIEEQTKTMMLAEVRDEYVFSTIDPPVVAEERAKPNRALICVVITFFGGVVAVLSVFVFHLVRRRQSDD